MYLYMVKQFFTDEHEMIQETVRMFANDKLTPIVDKMDTEDYFPLNLF